MWLVVAIGNKNVPEESIWHPHLGGIRHRQVTNLI